MFRQRTSTQKPGDEFLADFRSQFPEIVVNPNSPTTTSTQLPTAPAPDEAADHPAAPGRSQSIGDVAFRDQDPTPRASSNEAWRFTPSMLDLNSYSFNFPNTQPGYYTPTPGGTNTIFHPQAGDLHTPNMGMGHLIQTPLSMPTNGEPIQPGTTLDMSGFQALQPHQFHHFNPFIQAPPPQQAFAPSSFVHQDTGYETMDQDGSPVGSDRSEGRMATIGAAMQQSTSPMGIVHPRPLPDAHISHMMPSSAEQFRFHCALNAPTAMIKQSDEIPVTYLNKGQAYSLSIVDAKTTIPITPGKKYRTFVRVSFEDDEQRQKPGVCWSLWKEGRGTNEAHQRGGKLQAVEYVEAGQPVDGDERRTRVELETSSFDGFSVVWTPGLNGPPEVNVAVRFNFLSTDFSHSKGVKGIPVRLCTKTSALPGDSSPPADDTAAEVLYCKVKLFRDHGAERKLSNDIAHVKKSIDKIKQQISQAESGMKDFGKRRRSTGVSKGDSHKPGKVPKHKRTWSISSASSAGGGSGGNKGRMTLEEDLHFKLQTLQDMFSSTRPVSVLYLRGEDLDDPDLHPVSMPGEMSPVSQPELLRDDAQRQALVSRDSITDSALSQSPSSPSLNSQASAIGPGGQWQNYDAFAHGGPGKRHAGAPTKVPKTDDAGKLSGWIEALGVDPLYKPPPERKPKPVACFYILHKGASDAPHYHRAVYLTQRTLSDLKQQVSAKWGLDPLQVRRILHTTDGGLDVEMDDDVVRELNEGQDMELSVESVKPPTAKREWEMSVDSTDHLAPDRPALEAGGHILRLSF